MISKQMKIKSVAAIALIAFLGAVVFGFILMMDTNTSMNQSMASECPYATVGGKVCPQGVLGVIVHHISLYQSFTNVPINFGMAALMISLLLVVSAILAIFIKLSLFGPSVLNGIFYNSPLNSLYKRKISRWLSLHENSPATV